MPFSKPVPLLNDSLRSNKSKPDTNDESMKDSLLKRAIKENENSIIQTILSSTSQLSSSLTATNSSNSEGVKTRSDGLSLLLDYLFEDGQLTRIEYDKVDKGQGVNSAEEQVQSLLRILMQSKDVGALKILLEWLNEIAPTSETVRKLCINFLPERQEDRSKVIFYDEMETEGKVTSTQIASKGSGKQEAEINTRVCFQLKFSLAAYNSSTKRHDFYYGRKQAYVPSGERRYDLDDSNTVSKATLSFNDTKRGIYQQKQAATKTKVPLDSPDLRDFYLTNGCLETIHNLILKHCTEVLSELRWEKVLRNMNRLLSPDVQFIKDLLYQIRTQEYVKTQEEEARVAKMVRKIYRERRKLHQPNNLEMQKLAEDDELESSSGSEEENQMEDVLFGQSRNQESTEENVQLGIQNKHGSSVNWKQVVYHSFQIWKQRNGSNSTFYSLIGVFQHSHLYQTSDFLLEYKKEIQSRENEKDDDEGCVNDVNTTGAKPTLLLQLL